MIHVIRGIFLILVSAVAITYLTRTGADIGGAHHPATTGSATMGALDQGAPPANQVGALYIMIGGVIITFGIITVDVLVRRKNLSAISGLFLGILVGMLVSWFLGFLIEQAVSVLLSPDLKLQNAPLIEGCKLLLGLMVTYLTVSFVLQTKDDFRFIVPYVEFSRATKGPRPLILDTSVIIDGRIADVAASGVFESRMLVPRFVLNELQTVADSSDRLKRLKGRRGLDILQRLQAMPRLELHIWDGSLVSIPETEGVDQKLVALAQQENGRVLTTDFNLNKIAQLRGVQVVNMNELAEALKPVVLPGEHMKVRIIKPGEAAGQGVGYLEDGTMVVVENARDKVGMEVEIAVTNAIQKATGKMIFGKVESRG
jgi:uncharacterized protein YacL